MRLGSLDGKGKRLIPSWLRFTRTTSTDFHVGGRLLDKTNDMIEFFQSLFSLLVRPGLSKVGTTGIKLLFYRKLFISARKGKESFLDDPKESVVEETRECRHFHRAQHRSVHHE
jgi:hypothetical protein